MFKQYSNSIFGRSCIRLVVTNKKAPCKECKERYLGCHDKCSHYKEYKKDLDDKKRIITEAKNKNKELFALKRDSITKSIRRNKSKKP